MPTLCLEKGAFIYSNFEENYILVQCCKKTQRKKGLGGSIASSGLSGSKHVNR
jgi:hypothetical protein